MPSSSRPRYFLKRKKLLKKSASESNVAESLPPAPTTAFDHQAEPDSEQGDTQALPSTPVSTRDLVSAITTTETIETADSIDVNNGADDESSPKTESCYTDTISPAIRAANGGVEIENAFQAVSDGGRSAAGETMSSEVSKLLTSPIKIHARVRPLDEQDSGGAAANRPRSVAVNGKKELVLSSRPSAKTENAGNRHTFQFDYVMNETTTQREAYDITTQPLVERILQGFNACLIAYGTPATGKSHSLFGKASSGKHRGLITRATEVLLGSCNKENAEAKTKISMSFVQVYNEKIYDILDPSATDNIRFQEQSDPPALEGVTEWPVESVDDVTKQLRRNPNRVRESGRSHTIFTLRYRKETVADITVGNEDGETRRVLETLKGKLDFVDLVGVERTTKHSTKDSTGNTAVAKTNKSLQVFHNVVHCLLVKDATVSPYRDSKLTRMLHESMGGSCYTSLLVTVSPCPNFAHETLGCLNFVSKISSIENNPTSHVTVQEMKEIPTEAVESSSSLEDSSDRFEFLAADDSHESGTSSTLPPIVMKPFFTPDNTRDPGSEPEVSNSPEPQSAASLTAAVAPVEFAECKDTRSRPKQRGLQEHTADTLQARLKRQKRRLSAKTRDDDSSNGVVVDKQEWAPASRSGLRPSWQQLSLDGKELTSNGKVVPLPRIDTPEPARKDQDQLFLAPFRTKTPPSLLDVSNMKSRYSIDSPISSPQATEVLVSKLAKSPKSARNTKSLDTFHPSVSDIDVVMRTPPQTPKSSENHSTFSVTSSSSCCSRCSAREEKIRSDYDRMILLSKRDRDEKQQQIVHLKNEIHRIQKESSWKLERMVLEGENKKMRSEIDALKAERTTLSVQLDSFKETMSNMVLASELSSIQELRRKESHIIDEQKCEIMNLENQLAKQVTSATEKLEMQSKEQTELTAKISRLEKEINEKDESAQAALLGFEKTLITLADEKEEMAAKLEKLEKGNDQGRKAAADRITELEASVAEIDEHAQQLERNKCSLEKELQVSKAQVVALHKTVESLEVNTPAVETSDASTNTVDMRHRLKGLAYYVYCLRCAAFFETNDNASISEITAAKMRLLLIQDAKNQETLLQINRERNLLRDVMRIMYARRWFTEEGKPHVKRALENVKSDFFI